MGGRPGTEGSSIPIGVSATLSYIASACSGMYDNPILVKYPLSMILPINYDKWCIPVSITDLSLWLTNSVLATIIVSVMTMMLNDRKQTK